MKLLADIDGLPLIARTIASLTNADIREVVVVISPASDPALHELLRTLPVTVVVNPAPERGMFSSIQVGLAAATSAPVVVLPADMPFVRSDTVRTVVELARQTGKVAIASLGTRRGHPVAIPEALCASVSVADPSRSLKDALVESGVLSIDVPVLDPGVLRDVDVPADLTRGSVATSGGQR